MEEQTLGYQWSVFQICNYIWELNCFCQRINKSMLRPKCEGQQASAHTCHSHSEAHTTVIAAFSINEGITFLSLVPPEAHKCTPCNRNSFAVSLSHYLKAASEVTTSAKPGEALDLCTCTGVRMQKWACGQRWRRSLSSCLAPAQWLLPHSTLHSKAVPLGMRPTRTTQDRSLSFRKYDDNLKSPYV